MELRKMPHLDLGKKRSMFLNIGLAISLSMTIMAFEWNYGEMKLVELPELEEEFVETFEISPTVIPPAPPPVIQPIINIVPDEKIPEEMPEVILDPEEIEPLIIEDLFFTEKEEPIIDAPVDFAEHMPVPLNGLNEYYKFISKNIKYPNQARRMGIKGKVFVQFVINKEGEAVDIKTVKGIGAGCDEEAERVIGIAPNWKPGKQGARRVSVRMILPIHFNLN